MANEDWSDVWHVSTRNPFEVTKEFLEELDKNVMRLELVLEKELDRQSVNCYEVEEIMFACDKFRKYYVYVKDKEGHKSLFTCNRKTAYFKN